MVSLQDILNDFSNSELGKARNDKLVTYSKRRPVYEYNSKGQIIQIIRSAGDLRKMGIRIENKRDFIITKDGRIFSLLEDIPNFNLWYRKRRKQLSCKVIQLTVDGQFVKKWDSLMDVEKQLGIERANIRRYFKQGSKNKFGEPRTVGGYIWKEDNNY